MEEMYYVYFGNIKLGKFQISVLENMAQKGFITSNTILEHYESGKKIHADDLESLSFPDETQTIKPVETGGKARKWNIPEYWFWPAVFLLILLAAIIGTVLGEIFH